MPPGFREAMRDCEIQSYRVFFFEKRGDEFYIPPENYPREALACVSLHDLHTLAGWWSGHDIGVRQKIGMLADTEFPDAEAHRAHQRRRALGLLAEKGLMPAEMEPVLRGGEAPRELPESLAVAFHRLIARTPSRLVVVQAEELTGALDQVNIPGTTSEHRELAAQAFRRPGGAAKHAAFPGDHRGAAGRAAEGGLSRSSVKSW